MTIEKQYEASFAVGPVTLGPMASSTWTWDPKRLGMVLARYKFVGKMLAGLGNVAEIGCADGFGAHVVKQFVKAPFFLFDMDHAWARSVAEGTRSVTEQTRQDGKTDVVLTYLPFFVHDITKHPLGRGDIWRAIYMLDVLEHIRPGEDEDAALFNICASLDPLNGIFITGSPSAESQAYASEGSRQGHVNCKTEDETRATLGRFFENVFLFGMNDEQLNCSFGPMQHYRLAVCTGPKFPTPATLFWPSLVPTETK